MNESEFNSLPLAQRKAIQQRLIDAGLYAGKADGRFGSGTAAGLKAEERRRIDDEERQRKGKIEERASEAAAKKDEAAAKATDAATAEATRKTQAREARAKEAGSGVGIATQIGANVLAPAGGAAAGMGMGKLTNLMLDTAQESRNNVLQGVARDRISGLTTRDAAQQAAQRAGAVPMSSPAARTAARMAPHVGLGLLSIGKGAQTLGQQDPDAPFYADMANRAAGLGYIGAGAGLMKQGMRYGAAPGVAPDAQALAVINSPQLRRSGQSSALVDAMSKGQIVDADVISETPRAALPAPDTPEPKPLSPGTTAYMRQQLKDFGVKGTSKMNKRTLAATLAEQMAEHGAKRTVSKKLPKGTGKAALPLAIGSYVAATGDSEAADGSLAGRATDAAANFATGAGAAYGGSKLAEMLAKASPAIMGGISGGLSAMTPSVIDDMTSPDEENLNMARNRAARTLPEFMQGGAVREAAEMAQVPQRSPANSGPRMDGPFANDINVRLRRMTSGGATPEQIAHFLNSAVR